MHAEYIFSWTFTSLSFARYSIHLQENEGTPQVYNFVSLVALVLPCSMLLARVAQELRMAEQDPPQGVALWPKEGRMNDLEATIDGPPGTPYEGGVFRLSVQLPDRYPYEPPKVKVCAVSFRFAHACIFYLLAHSHHHSL